MSDAVKAAEGNTGTGADDASKDQGVSDELVKLRSINERLQGKLTDVEKKYNQFTNMYKDVDPDEYKKLKGTLEEKERELAAKDPVKMEEIWNRKLIKVQTELQGENKALADTLQALKAENKSLKVTDKVMAEISGLFQQDALKFIKREVEDLCDLDEDGTIVIKDENGDRQFRNAKYLGIKDFGEMLVEKYPSLAKSQGTGGAKDLTPGQKVTGRGNTRIPETWAELQQMPNQKEVFEKLKRENPEALAKLAYTVKI